MKHTGRRISFLHMKRVFGVRRPSSRVAPGESHMNDVLRKKIAAVVHPWYHRVEVAPGIFTPGVVPCQDVLQKLGLPEDCTGLRVLDLGARDGFYAIMLQKRGAKEVVALDFTPAEKTGFPVLKEVFGFKGEYVHDSVYNLSRKKYGEFDIILCMGLLYHLRNPLLALDKIREVCKSELYVESFVIDECFIKPEGSHESLSNISEELARSPIMQFYPRSELNGDYTNWWGPNSACLQQMLEATNFTVISVQVDFNRAILKCRINEDPTASYYRKMEKDLMK